jgi:hypothetical protein
MIRRFRPKSFSARGNHHCRAVPEIDDPVEKTFRWDEIERSAVVRMSVNPHLKLAPDPAVGSGLHRRFVDNDELRHAVPLHPLISSSQLRTITTPL